MDALQILQQLSEPDRLPIEAIRAARNDRDSMVPMFLRCIDEFSLPNGTPIAPFALFFIFHLLGEWREKSAYRPLAELLRMPNDAIEPIFGDAKTETCHRVMAAVFDGDPDPLYEIVRDKDADEYVRSRMCQAIAMLTQQGDLPRAEAAQFFRDCYAHFEPEDNCFVWHGWLDAVAWLGIVDLEPLVREAFMRGSIDPTWLTFEDFEEDLRHAIDHPGAQPLTLMATSPCSAIPSRNWRIGIVSSRRHGPSASQSRRRHFTSPTAIFSVRSAATILVHAAAARNSKNAVWPHPWTVRFLAVLPECLRTLRARQGDLTPKRPARPVSRPAAGRSSETTFSDR